MRITFLSSYPPTPCGIAEFNMDLINSLNKIEKKIKVMGVAINKDNSLYQYSPYVYFQIRKQVQDDYIKAAEKINYSQSDILVIQHEFGLYGGFGGKYIIPLIKKVEKPIILIAHTIPLTKTAHKLKTKERFFKETAPFIKKFIVIIPDSKEKLISYNIPSSKIDVISHGAPDILSFKTENIREKLNLDNSKFYILSFGLLHKKKGFEYAIKAMKKIKEKKLNIKLIIIGTALRESENYEYVRSLKEMIKNEKLLDYVEILEKYLSKNELYDYINTCDIGLLPYTNPNHVSSGPLSFLVAALKPTIITRFPYAKYLLNEKNACFVPFRNSKAIADCIIKLYKDKNFYRQIVENLKRVSQDILWEKKAFQYLELFKKIIIDKNHQKNRP